MEELRVKDQIMRCYLLNNNMERLEQEYTGLCMFKYRDESKGEWGYYRNGKREGKVIRWDRESGVYKGNYVNDIAEGEMIAYYVSGSIEESNCYNGKKEGKSILKWQDGGVEKRNYENGMKIGEAIRYFSDGSKEKIFYINNVVEGDSIYYYVDGSYEKRKYVNNRIVGNGMLVFPDGRYKIINHKDKNNEVLNEESRETIENIRKEVIILKKRIEKLEERVLENKEIKKEKINKRDIYGRKQGEWKEEFHGYKGKGFYLDNEKNGEWEYWLNTGENYKIEKYEKGEKLGEKYLISNEFEAGVLKWQRDIKGKKQGEWIERICLKEGRYVYTKEFCIEVVNYKDNILQGEYKRYGCKGNLLEEGNYINGKKCGLMMKYSKTKEVEIMGEYKEGIKQGLWCEYSEIGRYIDGKKEGIWKSELGEEKTYKNNLLIGKYCSYFTDGSLDSEEEYTEDGKCKTIKRYYKNKQIKEKVTYIYEGGMYIVDGKALRKKSQSTYLVGEYKKGVKIGIWREYDSYEDMLKIEGIFLGLEDMRV